MAGLGMKSLNLLCVILIIIIIIRNRSAYAGGLCVLSVPRAAAVQVECVLLLVNVNERGRCSV